MRNFTRLSAAALLATAAAALPAPANATTVAELEKDGYSCGRGSVNGYLCTKSGNKSYVCDNAKKNCHSIRYTTPESIRPPLAGNAVADKPSSRPGFGSSILGTGILNDSPGLASQGPAANGLPVGPRGAPAAPSAPPVIIR
jgi:hypothetical protein